MCNNTSHVLPHKDIAEAGYRSALDSLYCAAVILDLYGHCLYHNPSASELLSRCGIDIEVFVGCLSQQINLADGQGRFSFVVQEISFICNVYPWVSAGERKGSALILHEEMHPVCSEMEANLTANMLREINAILEASCDGMIVTNSEGCVTRINTAAVKLLGIEQREVLGRNVRALIAEGVCSDSAVLKVIETLQPATVMITTRDSRQLLITGAPVWDGTKRLTSVVANLRDLSELNKLRQRLEEQQQLTEAYQRELVKLNQRRTDNIVANSREMLQLLETVDSIAEVDSTVLVTGESGVGKEVVVNRIYKTSNRHHMPFIKINCGAIPPALFESELFGYEEGSFTGARKKGKAGFFELANGGTLFLDEIGELSLDLQVKLLRVIQEGELTRIGGSHSISVDVRIIAATNRDLWSLTQKGKFRQDLFYRLNVISLEIPPLRNRRDDILPLAIHFLNKYNRKYEKKKVISFELGKMLRSLDWPGNIRELENLIENLVVLTRDVTLLKPSHLPPRYRTQRVQGSGVTVCGVLPLREALEQTEIQLLRNAKTQFGSTRAIATALKVNQSTIVRKLRALPGHDDISKSEEW